MLAAELGLAGWAGLGPPVYGLFKLKAQALEENLNIDILELHSAYPCTDLCWFAVGFVLNLSWFGLGLGWVGSSWLWSGMVWV